MACEKPTAASVYRALCDTRKAEQSAMNVLAKASETMRAAQNAHGDAAREVYRLSRMHDELRPLNGAERRLLTEIAANPLWLSLGTKKLNTADSLVLMGLLTVGSSRNADELGWQVEYQITNKGKKRLEKSRAK